MFMINHTGTIAQTPVFCVLHGIALVQAKRGFLYPEMEEPGIKIPLLLENLELRYWTVRGFRAFHR